MEDRVYLRSSSGLGSSWYLDGIQFAEDAKKKGSTLYLAELRPLLRCTCLISITHLVPKIWRTGTVMLSTKNARTRIFKGGYYSLLSSLRDTNHRCYSQRSPGDSSTLSASRLRRSDPPHSCQRTRLQIHPPCAHYRSRYGWTSVYRISRPDRASSFRIDFGGNDSILGPDQVCLVEEEGLRRYQRRNPSMATAPRGQHVGICARGS
jgi:hypothetical protein